MQSVPVTKIAKEVTQTVSEPLTLWQKIQQYWHQWTFNTMHESIGGTHGMLRIGMWFGVAFTLGYLCKKYCKTTACCFAFDAFVY